jgi:hypothetical protein
VDGPYDPGFVNVAPGTYDFYSQWVYHENDTITFVRDEGPIVLGIITAEISADGHELEMVVPYEGFLVDENGDPIIGIGSTLDLSFSLEASGELAPGQQWASDTAEPINGFFLAPLSQTTNFAAAAPAPASSGDIAAAAPAPVSSASFAAAPAPVSSVMVSPITAQPGASVHIAHPESSLDEWLPTWLRKRRLQHLHAAFAAFNGGSAF